MVSHGAVFINDMVAGPDARLMKGDRLSIELIDPPDKLFEAENHEVPVVYEDPWLLIVDKPVGVIAHPIGSYQTGTLCNRVQFHLNQQSPVRGILRPGIVHRLDRMTSGLLVIAKTSEAHAVLSDQFEQGRPRKDYLALVHGCPDFCFHSVRTPIGQRPDCSVLMSCSADAVRSREARTDVRVESQFRSASLLQCGLFTGRNHQIRVHLASIGHPVLGDAFYRTQHRVAGFGDSSQDFEQRHALHAFRLQFQHPILPGRIEVMAAPPADFWECLQAAGASSD